MALVSSYEILSLKNSRWEVMAVTDNKHKAMVQAEQHLEKGFFSAIQVIEERYDEDSGESSFLVIFNRVKVLRKTSERYTGPERRQGKDWRQDPKGHGRDEKSKPRTEASRRSEPFVQQMIRGSLILLLILWLGVLGVQYIVENFERYQTIYTR
jgi:hypothetical protein